MMTAVDLGLALFLKPACVLAVAAVLAAGLRRGSAAARHGVWAAGVTATLAIPLLGGVLPKLRLPVLPPALDQNAAASTPGIRSGPAAWESTASGARSASERLEHPARRGNAAAPAERVPLVLTVVWLLGAVTLCTRRLVATLRVRRIVAGTLPVRDPRILRLLLEAARSSGGRPRPVDLRTGDGIRVPATAGLLRSVILLPEEAGEWTDAEVSSVLAHELGHVQRRDCLVRLLADLAASLYWCNPLVRLAVHRLELEGERSCDDIALQSGARPWDYAGLLLRFAGAGRSVQEIPRPALAMARTGQLETRLRALLDERVSHAPPRRMTSLLLVSLAMLSSLPAAAITLELAHAPARWLAGPEPDTLGDALATPESERLPPATSVARPDTARLFAGPDSALARSLVAALGHEPTHAADLVRDRARWALGRARDGRLVEPLLEALDHPDWRARSYAAWALAVAGDERAVPRLIELLSDPVWRMRAMAAAALRASGDPRAEAAMRAALTDPAWQVRMEAVEYFAALDGPGMRERLAPRLEDRHVAVRQAAERAFSH